MPIHRSYEYTYCPYRSPFHHETISSRNLYFILRRVQVARLCSFIQKWAPPQFTISGVFKLKSQLVMNARHIPSFRKGFAGLLSFWRGWTRTVNVRLISLTLWWWIIVLLKYILCTAVNFTKITFSCFLREAVWMCIAHVKCGKL